MCIGVRFSASVFSPPRCQQCLRLLESICIKSLGEPAIDGYQQPGPVPIRRARRSCPAVVQRLAGVWLPRRGAPPLCYSVTNNKTRPSTNRMGPQ